MTTTYRCPKCDTIMDQPTAARAVYHLCPKARRIVELVAVENEEQE